MNNSFEYDYWKKVYVGVKIKAYNGTILENRDYMNPERRHFIQ